MTTSSEGTYYNAVEGVVHLLRHVGEDIDREGLRGTPERVVNALREMTWGYDANIPSLLTTFEDGACDEMVVLKGVEFSSLCEHHLLPFSGHAHIAYIPNGRVIGVSKLARLLDVFACRLQIQERVTQQVTEALDRYLEPLGSACVLEASHLCMSCRGVKKKESVMVTSSLTGAFREPEARSEFFSLIR